jgi:hypothetical protein
MRSASLIPQSSCQLYRYRVLLIQLIFLFTENGERDIEESLVVLENRLSMMDAYRLIVTGYDTFFDYASDNVVEIVESDPRIPRTYYCGCRSFFLYVCFRKKLYQYWYRKNGRPFDSLATLLFCASFAFGTFEH